METVKEVAKALTGALTAFGAAYAAALVGDGSVTGSEWVSVGVATAVAGLAVWAVPNQPKA